MTEELNFTTKHFDELRKVMGKRYLRTRVTSPYDFIHIATKGLNANVIKNFRVYFDLSLDTTAHMLNVSEPSIYRWTKSNKILERNLSVKLFEISGLFLYGSEIFGSKEALSSKYGIRWNATFRTNRYTRRSFQNKGYFGKN